MVNGLSNLDKLVMSLNSIIDNSCFETFFGRLNAELSFFANLYKQSELLPWNQIAELNHINSWTLYFDISMNKHGTDVGCLQYIHAVKELIQLFNWNLDTPTLQLSLKP